MHSNWGRNAKWVEGDQSCNEEIAAANLLPRGRTRLIPCLPRSSPTPSEMGANLAVTSPHPGTHHIFPGIQRAKVQRKTLNLHKAAQTRQKARPVRPPPSAQRAPTSRSSPLLLLLSTRDLLRRIYTTKRTHSFRIRANKRQHQSMAHGPLAGATPGLTPGLSPEDGSSTSTLEEHAQPRLEKRSVVSGTP